MKTEIQNYIRIEMKSIHEEKKKENSIWNSFADYERDLEKIKMEKDKAISRNMNNNIHSAYAKNFVEITSNLVKLSSVPLGQIV